jgi:hypothetical protein
MSLFIPPSGLNPAYQLDKIHIAKDGQIYPLAALYALDAQNNIRTIFKTPSPAPPPAS